jgi:glycosyltransferase involved in cell wall biosynthesis
VQAGADAIVFETLGETSRSLRLAVVTETYPPEVNGVATSAARFVEGLRARGHTIQLVRPRQQRDGAREAADAMLVRGMAIPQYPNLRFGLPCKRTLVRTWSQQRPDVVHVVTQGPLGWSALQAAAKLKLPVVSDFRTNFHAYSAHYGVGWLKRPIVGYLRRFHNRTACTLAPTEAVRRELTQLGFRGVQVVARGVDTKLFDPARRDAELRARWGAGEHDPVVLYVGRLAPEKNLVALAQAWDRVQRRTPRARLVLVGDGPSRSELEARFPAAVFCGTRTGEDLAAHYASGDVFLFPSVTETYGNVTLEAMASGLVVVAFDYAAAAEVIQHGQNGLLVPFGDGDAFAAHATALTADLGRARRLGAAARETALGRSWDAVVRELEEVLLSSNGNFRALSPALWSSSSGASRTQTTPAPTSSGVSTRRAAGAPSA